jgi:hypothetical protein
MMLLLLQALLLLPLLLLLLSALFLQALLLHVLVALLLFLLPEGLLLSFCSLFSLFLILLRVNSAAGWQP